MGYVLKAVLSSAQHPEYGQIMAILRKQKITVSVYAVLPFPASIRGTSIAMIFASRRCTDRNTLW